ncbi:unnamed protein product [Aphanomyces euteiches]|uniref:Uncharacterized protein n=1 Tax=Aphanomyces euteiches TaxID=100861 RepID=A0A6G0X1K4_9STRA|nr:hypothetical protein Ae201684_009338 [Aphanomyces euteiches]KAH9070173.1 hypothetical protein Ae201684P_002542 [Aphanomyces euteiches]KAH9141894.1 hypothetical protein AeRB84_013967 [Aphanomyces euteiches]
MAGRWIRSILLTASAVAFHLPPDHARGGELFADLIKGAVSFDVSPQAQWFEQQLDHFTTKAPLHFSQRYYVDDRFWGNENSNPIILYIGGEGSMDKMPTGYIDVLAKEHKAKVVALEHRFYGKSTPKDDLSTDNLRFLTVEQALADLNHFISEYSKTLDTKGNPWLAVGGSYPGALSAWFRIAYPNATVAAISSSGVVNPIYNFHGFDEQVAESAGLPCANALRLITAAYEAEIAAGRGKEVKGLLGAEALSDPDFFYMLADSAAMAVQYGKKDKLCGPIVEAVQSNASLTHVFANFTISMYGPAFGYGCFYDTKCLQTDVARWPEGRSWRWQKCSQLAYFQVAPHKDSLRSAIVNLDYHESQCYKIFGDVVDPSAGVARTIQRYGGDSPHGHNIFYANAGDDPWQRASVTTTLSKDQPFYLAKCDLCGHCGDLSDGVDDPAPRRYQKELIRQYVKKWLAPTMSKVELDEISQISTESGESILPHAGQVSFMVLLPIMCLFVAFKAVMHVDLVRDMSDSVRTSLL